MKVLSLVFIFVLSLTFSLNVFGRPSDNVLREEALDYLRDARQLQMLYDQRKEINRRIQELEQVLFNKDESTESDEYEKIVTRRKAVGLGDNPFK